ncbi:MULTISPECIES: LysR substrate-binding domain-containing protein [Paraburkholderia]|uniref:LysR family transcriptional regulator n=1 Tax=Paraburkholderia caribensis TaxID=75105 RepID=A0A9Q6WQB4_9BURK|nr:MULTISPECIES: LysR substrate-binding domain-containing protein [Paraburkholderia]ALP67457.1 LysR family transcriptional regulator [Paraburkholderia caribensis]AMV48190.1 LysR family transcriptional regulator [Paraburkholderia caribensis]AUT57186.1 LysR family transcriptional regulator [Paraburkholderia caribensis]MCO4881651.1 LysR substrate-binding domain-containing protein [Paraburkholderia caribensis]MDR6380477.1 DNA-binding transcriptional LysR family regulator [Paraburkholderia caribens
MTGTVQPTDLSFFSTLAASGSLSAAARELGLTPAAVSKRLTQMEQRAGVPLVNRTTRRMMLTPEGEVYLEHARRILDEIDALSELLGSAKKSPKGLLRVNATLGFGRSHVAPAISRFVNRYPQVAVQLQLSVTPPPLTDDAFDVCIRFGEPPDTRVVARRLAPNRRLLCAAPSYIAEYGMPITPRELVRHNCIGIRQGDEAYGVWRLATGRGAARKTEAVRINGNLTTNDGEIAVKWALDGHGVLMRAEWDVNEYLADGRLVQVLPGFETPGADIFAVYSQRHQMSARIRTFVDFIAGELREAREG